MNINRLTFEHLLFALALVLAIGIRFLNLGASPLNDAEAGWALQAVGIAQGSPVSLGSQPAYIFLTGLVFSLFGSSDFFARFWPALIGAGLVLLPLFFRRLLSREAALILAFGLALDPGLVAASRQAGSPMLAAGFGLLSLGLAYTGLPILAGIFGGLALLSGPALLPGLLALVLAWTVILLLDRLVVSAGVVGGDEMNGFVEPPGGIRLPISIRRPALAALLVTLLAAGTLFLRFPQGLGAWAGILPDYINGWLVSPRVPALRLLAGLFVYQPLAVFFAAVGLVQVWTGISRGNSLGDRLGFGRLASLFSFFALVLVLLYPARQMVDLAWVLVPLWILAASGLAGSWSWAGENRLASIAQGVLIFVLLALFWLNLSALSMSEPGVQAYTLRLGLLGGVLALAGLTTALVALGWNWDVARRGVLLGGLAAFGLFVLSNTAHVSLFQPVEREDVQDLWGTASPIGDAELFLNTIGDLSAWHTGLRDSIDLVVEVDSPSLRWALRGYPKAQYLPSEAPVSSTNSQVETGIPSIIITSQAGQEPAQSAAYRGQDFNWWLRPAWSGVFPPNFIRWFVFRQAPVQPEALILWARTDLFPGGETLLPEDQPQEPQGEAPLQPEVAR